MSDVLALPKKIDLDAATELAAELSEKRGKDLTLGGGDVSQLSTPGLQVLLSAAKAWSDDGHQLGLDQPSDALLNQLTAFGLSTAEITTGMRED